MNMLRILTINYKIKKKKKKQSELKNRITEMKYRLEGIISRLGDTK